MNPQLKKLYSASTLAKYLQASYAIVQDLYSIYESDADETTALELRFLGEFQTSDWLILTDLDSEDKLKEYLRAMKYWNILRGFNAYISNAVHEWTKVQEKLERRRAQGYKTAKGDRNTVYPYIATLTWDLDIEALHSTKTVESRDKAISMAKELWKTKLEPFFDSIGMYPRFVLFTGGGLQLKFEAGKLYPISTLEEFKDLVDVITAIASPIAKADNIFDPARIVRAPFTINWGYKNPAGEVYPLLGAGIKKYDDAEVNFIELVKALKEWAEEQGIKITPKQKTIDMGAVEELAVKPNIRLRKIDPQRIYELLKPFYISGHQNDLLIRLFTLLARYRMDIFSALELLSLFVHDPKNTPDHVKNRLDHLTYPYGHVFNTIYKRSIKEIYGEDIYQRLAKFYNALVTDLCISYSESDFKRGLEHTEVSKIAGWIALKEQLLKVAPSVVGPEEANEVVKAVLDILRAELLEAPYVGGGEE